MTRTTVWWLAFGAARKPNRIRGGAVATAALLVLSACAAEGGGVTSAGGDPDLAAAAEQEQLDEQAQALAFAACMRENGFDMPDPEPGQEGLMSALRQAHGAHDQTTVDEDYAEAFDACEALLPEFAGDHSQPDDEAMLALAECLREQGLDVPDDLYSGGGMHDIDRDELNAAMEACRDVVDFGGHR
jgi:hypothetical protein